MEMLQVAPAWKTGAHLKFPKLHDSTHLLGNPAALRAAWERDGYWFFRGAIDPAAVSRLRDAYVSELVKLGVIDAGDPQYRYNGRDMGGLPANPIAGVIKGLFEAAPWREFVADPTVDGLARQLVGGDPLWVPIIGMRVSKPLSDPAAERFDSVHQDGFYNQGIPFLNVWVPLVELDDETGGLAIAEGQHRRGDWLHNLGQAPIYPIPPGSIPDESWRISQYHPGDVLVFDMHAPHTGVTNVSRDRFRMSIDLRLLAASGHNPVLGTDTQAPVVGTVAEISPTAVTVRREDGTLKTLSIDATTYCRGTHMNGRRIPATELPEHYTTGTAIIVAAEGEHAVVVRPSNY